MALGDSPGKVIDFRSRRKFGTNTHHTVTGRDAIALRAQRRDRMPSRATRRVKKRVWFASLVVLALLVLPLLIARFGDYQPLAQPVATQIKKLPSSSSSGRAEDVMPHGEGLSVSFTFCGDGVRRNCVVDGDTFWLNGEKIRIADIDTPELSPSRCDREKVKGEAAKRALLSELNAGGFQLVAYGSRDEDRYGRKLRTVLRHDRSIGDILVAKGHARPWTGSRSSWCE